MTKEFDPTPPPAIVQKQKREYQQIVAEISQLQQVSDETALEMGDRFIEVETAYGKEAFRKAADDSGVPWSVARQRHWVARRIPKGHKLRSYLEDTHLTYSHLRALATTENPEQWAETAIKEGLSVAGLIEKIEVKKEKTATAEGEVCIQCNQPLPEGGEIVSFRISGRGNARCCSVGHAAQYFSELLTDGEEIPADPFMAA